jgi:hypothetical protein
MKTSVFTFLAAGASIGIAHAQNTVSEFPRRSIECPALSLLGAADQTVQSRLRDALTLNLDVLDPRAITKMYSRMPIKKPDESIDAKIAKAPDSSIEYKSRVVVPAIESK